MRYVENQELFGVQFTHATFSQYPGLQFVQPLMHNDEQPTAINFDKFTVTKHAKVPNEHAGEGDLSCDGYILRDQNDVVFANQYPIASYGQLSNEGDRRFFMHLPEKQDFENQLEKNANTVFEYHLFNEVLERILRGIVDLDAIPLDATAEPQKTRIVTKLAGLKILRDRLVDQFQREYPDYRLVLQLENNPKRVHYGKYRVRIFRQIPVAVAKDLTLTDVVQAIQNDHGLIVSYPNGYYLSVSEGSSDITGYGETFHAEELRVSYYHIGEEFNPKIFNEETDERFDIRQVFCAAECFLKRLQADHPKTLTDKSGTPDQFAQLQKIRMTSTDDLVDKLMKVGRLVVDCPGGYQLALNCTGPGPNDSFNIGYTEKIESGTGGEYTRLVMFPIMALGTIDPKVCVQVYLELLNGVYNHAALDNAPVTAMQYKYEQKVMAAILTAKPAK